MTVTQMNYFMVLQDCLSFSKAAQMLNVTQPAISSAIRELEKECNVRLFERKKTALSLTEEGHILAQLIAPCLKQVEEVNDAAKHLDQINQHLRIGFTTLFGNYVYSGILNRLLRNAPQIQVSAKEASATALLQMLDSNQLDIILIVAGQRHPLDDSYGQVDIVDTALRFCVSSAHPLAWNRRVSWEEMAQIPLVMLSDHFSVSRNIQNEFRERNLTPNIIHRTDQVYTVERFIENNVAGGFLPEIVASKNKYISGLEYGDPISRATLKAVWRRDRFLSQAMQCFLDTTRAYAKANSLQI